jgi:hypothetical protein
MLGILPARELERHLSNVRNVLPDAYAWAFRGNEIKYWLPLEVVFELILWLVQAGRQSSSCLP